MFGHVFVTLWGQFLWDIVICGGFISTSGDQQLFLMKSGAVLWLGFRLRTKV